MFPLPLFFSWVRFWYFSQFVSMQNSVFYVKPQLRLRLVCRVVVFTSQSLGSSTIAYVSTSLPDKKVSTCFWKTDLSQANVDIMAHLWNYWCLDSGSFGSCVGWSSPVSVVDGRRIFWTTLVCVSPIRHPFHASCLRWCTQGLFRAVRLPWVVFTNENERRGMDKRRPVEIESNSALPRTGWVLG